MKKRIPKDGLEKFLQDSFEGHVDSPSYNLWDRIEDQLPEEEKDRPMIFWRWGIATLVASLLGVVLFQQFYFTKQLGHLNEKIIIVESKSKTSATLALPNPIISQAIEEEVKPNSALSQNQISNKVKETIPTRYSENVLIPETENKKHRIANNLPLSSDDVKVLLHDNGTFNESVKIIRKSNEDALLPVNVSPNNISNLGKIAKLPLAKLITETSTPSFNPIIDLGINKPSKFSIGLAIAPIYQLHKIELQPPFPISIDNSHLFKRRIESYGVHKGVNFGYQLNKRWSLDSGIAYQKLQSNFTHKPRLKFKDHLQNTNPPDGSYDFEYTVITSSGLVGLQLRVDQTDPNSNLNPDENVPLSLETKQTFHYLSVPLLVNYSLGLGRWNLYLEGGFQGRFLADHNFEIKNIESLSSKLTSRPNEKFRKPSNRPKEIALDYVSGVGVSFDIQAKWQVQSGFNFTSSLLNISPPHVINTQQSSFRLALGLTRKF